MFYDEASREHELYEEKITDWVQQMVEEGNGKEVDRKLLRRVNKYVYYISIVYWNMNISCLRFLNIKKITSEICPKSNRFKKPISEIECTRSIPYTLTYHHQILRSKFPKIIVFMWISPSIYDYHFSWSPKYSLVKKGWCCEVIKDLRFSSCSTLVIGYDSV